ncbi:hypothetical protein [Pyxidicoccus xibeiensis]|uniref:hypothetical protein n=1 Tax=Pyxidicoccus xibeiensis TaxID=2906759 RepID=UPI0020A7A70C|nr:hypothetical protein [Pyxidicoccus xibeiensis]MCP3136176.1 hypothetical protein [Pyxidicoccus xibeiensis]
MLRKLVLSSLLAPVLAIGACGPALEESGEPPHVGESAQPVLYAPPVPASGNILDSTAYMGRVELGSAVQTRFTTHPQYLSFGFSVRPGAQVKLEVTHLGSSMYLDTGLFVYGPRRADGSYGTLAVAQDDDAGYGQLSKVAALALAQGGDYLAVVSTGTGAGKQFRLQLDCLNGACAPAVDPALYATCDLPVATRLEECVEGTVEEYGVSLASAYDLCTGPDDAHAAYMDVCDGSAAAPAWCTGGESQFTQRMWPVCQEHYLHYYGLYTLALAPMTVPATLQADVAAANAQCGNWCTSRLETFTFAWTSTAAPRLDKVAEAYLSAPEYRDHRYSYSGELTFSQFADDVSMFWSALPHDLLAELASGTETVRIAHYEWDYMQAPSAMEWNDLYVVLFPQSHRVAVFHKTFWEI